MLLQIVQILSVVTDSTDTGPLSGRESGRCCVPLYPVDGGFCGVGGLETSGGFP